LWIGCLAETMGPFWTTSESEDDATRSGRDTVRRNTVKPVGLSVKATTTRHSIWGQNSLTVKWTQRWFALFVGFIPYTRKIH